MNEHDRLVLRKSLAAASVVSYAQLVADAIRSGEPLGPSVADMFLRAVEDHEAAREALVKAISEGERR